MSEQLCTKCKKFFGNPGSLKMCSVCYKNHQMTEKVITQASTFKIPQIPAAKEHKQVDHSRCFACKKKVGLLGTRCKSCDCSYCNAHRLPEDHKCEGNYIEMAKEEIKKNVTTVTAAKIEKI